MSISQGSWCALSSVLGAGREIGWIAVIEPYFAYLDESNIHDNALWCVVAGHLGRKEQWEDFDGKWKIGLGQRKSLHMKELQWNSKPERISRLLAKLGPIPASCGITRIFGAVRGQDYEDIVGVLLPQHPELRVLLDPFMVAVWPCIIQTLRHVPKDDRVLFTFEQHDNYGPLLSLLEDSFASDPLFNTTAGEPRMIIATVPKRATPRTEPADYLAFEMAQCLIDRTSFKAQAGWSILGDRWMVGQQVSREGIRPIVTAALMLANKANTDMMVRKAAIRKLIEESEGRNK
jgi:hypothetical protein